MKQLVLNIPEKKYNFFLKVIENFQFVKIAEEKEIKLSQKEKQFVDDIKESLHEVELHQQGKIKLKTLDQVLDEL
ncbi:MAG: hypothetical protein HY738_09630 [Bacteroidia bacterium]|nr:hypothetical protein [Bacteroidia bacterium]